MVAILTVGVGSAVAFGGSETSTATAPPGGQVETHTDGLPADAKAGSFMVQPTTGTDPAAFDEVTSVLVEDFPWLAKVSKHNQAVLACVMLSYLPIANKPVNEPITFDDVNKQLLMLHICLQMALSIPNTAAAPDRAHSAAGACGRVGAAVTVRVTRSRSGYHGVVTSRIRRPNRPRLLVSCRRKGRGIVLSVRPRKRGQSLRAAAGPTLAIAYHNPTDKPIGIRTTFRAH